MADFEKKDINYTAIAFRNPMIDTWTLPQFIQGCGEEVEKNYAQMVERSCVTGSVDKHNIGLEVWVVGCYNDGTGEFISFPIAERRKLTEITSPDMTRIHA